MLFRKSYESFCFAGILALVACGTSAGEDVVGGDIDNNDSTGSAGMGGSGGDEVSMASAGAGGVIPKVDAGATGGAQSGGAMGGGGGRGGNVVGMSGGSAGSAPANQAIRIQPLGDSITQGKKSPDEATYRRPLWKKLQAAGYKIDFVGSTNQQLDGAPFYNDYDHDHEGHYGWKITDVLPKLDGWLSGYTPDVSLIHLGTNDQGSNNPAQMVLNIGTMIDKLRAKNPKVIVIVAKLIEPSPVGRAFGDMLPALATQKGTAQSPIVVVDQDVDFSNVDTIDGIHPNPTGQEKMATKWFDALVKVLPKPL